MDIITHIVAVIAGLIAAYFSVDYLLAIYHHRNFRSEEKYLILYDELDSEHHYKMISQIGRYRYESYALYLENHQEFRELAFRRYNEEMKNIQVKLFLMVVVPTFILALFGASAIGVFIAFYVLSSTYLCRNIAVGKKHDADFYITLVHSLAFEKQSE